MKREKCMREYHAGNEYFRKMPTTLVIIFYRRCHTNWSIKNGTQNSKNGMEQKSDCKWSFPTSERTNKKVIRGTDQNHETPTLFSSIWNGFCIFLTTRVTKYSNRPHWFADLGNNSDSRRHDRWLRRSWNEMLNTTCAMLRQSYTGTMKNSSDPKKHQPADDLLVCCKKVNLSTGAYLGIAEWPEHF